jgi:hypothetical protein
MEQQQQARLLHLPSVAGGVWVIFIYASVAANAQTDEKINISRVRYFVLAESMIFRLVFIVILYNTHV